MDPLLAANFDDIVGLIVTLAIIGFSVLSQIMSDRGPKRKAPPKPPRAKPPNPAIDSEIEAFLRQARAAGAPATRQTEGPPPVKVMEAQPIEVEPLIETLAESRTRLAKSSTEPRLAQATESADERIEQHLEEVFDHEIGAIASAEEIEYEIDEGTDSAAWQEKVKEATVASEVAEMMNSPESIRKLFIVTEVLKRPEI